MDDEKSFSIYDKIYRSILERIYKNDKKKSISNRNKR